MDDGKALWERVCATVTPLGLPGSKRRHRPVRDEMIFKTLDLHGYRVDDAYQAVCEFFENSPAKYVTIITGRSGVICREFPFWMERLGHSYEILNGGGSFRVRLR